MDLTQSFQNLLQTFSPVFTQPSFATFQLLMTGWIVSVRHRYITDLIISSDSVDFGHFSDYHRFFSHAVWDIDQLWKLLATLIVNTLVGQDATLFLAGDDTLCRKRGLGIFGTGMHHDALSSSKSKKLFHSWTWKMVHFMTTMGYYQYPIYLFLCSLNSPKILYGVYWIRSR